MTVLKKDKQTRAYYESERKNVITTHEDFCMEQNFDYVEDTEKLNEYLISRVDWDDYFKTNSKGEMSSKHTYYINEIFGKLIKDWGNKIDSVGIFDIITKFYNMDYTKAYSDLLYKHRELLKKDLSIRLNGKISSKADKYKFNNEKIQLSFEKIFKK